MPSTQPTPAAALPAAPKPSAWMTATLRAAHQLFDPSPIMRDELAVRILGARRVAELRADEARHRHPLAVAMRAAMAVRARLAEDSWREARQRGIGQYAILGAGLDTSAYRFKDSDSATRIFEVDLPDMQRWKRACLRAAGIAEPSCVRYAASDFKESALIDDLLQAGFSDEQPACFSWLGVSMYLPPDAVMRTLQDIADGALGTTIVFDYCVPRTHLTPAECAGRDHVAGTLAAQGEHLLSSFDPQGVEHMLRHFGFRQVEHFGAQELTACYLSGRGDGMRLSGVFRMIRATV